VISERDERRARNLDKHGNNHDDKGKKKKSDTVTLCCDCLHEIGQNGGA